MSVFYHLLLLTVLKSSIKEIDLDVIDLFVPLIGYFKFSNLKFLSKDYQNYFSYQTSIPIFIEYY